MAGIIFYHPRLGEKRSKIMEEAFRLVQCWFRDFIVILWWTLYRRADRDGNGRITVEEIMTVFKVIYYTIKLLTKCWDLEIQVLRKVLKSQEVLVKQRLPRVVPRRAEK